jgi:hypothetical protein
VDDKTLSTIRHAVCAIGSVTMPLEAYHADPMRGRFDIEGTGFLIGQRGIQTCAHVIESLEQKGKKRGDKPFSVGVQFVHPPRPGADAEMTTSFRPFTVIEQSDVADIWILRMQGRNVPCEPVPSCQRITSRGSVSRLAFADMLHGSALLTRGGVVYRFGPVVQSGIIAALSPYERSVGRLSRSVRDVLHACWSRRGGPGARVRAPEPGHELAVKCTSGKWLLRLARRGKMHMPSA